MRLYAKNCHTGREMRVPFSSDAFSLFAIVLVHCYTFRSPVLSNDKEIISKKRINMALTLDLLPRAFFPHVVQGIDCCFVFTDLFAAPRTCLKLTINEPCLNLPLTPVYVRTECLGFDQNLLVWYVWQNLAMIWYETEPGNSDNSH